ncbi:Ribose-phosphate pyrophosphokinase [Candidatus Lokiarchaeum ossiferum]|uniref:ribose-phosphate diphosphokinase n=1 Tax=Candidatus Lokiarchaeum ossiferum TaxID=2951803 RepID=A0ABY6HZG3_9ARCH|nr:Ribose-phosphate pyrophosphokinase [Candidatus Lokiarchaeum sp. B-35]
MSNQIVIAGPSSQGLAVNLANYLDVQVYATENKVFPDGECYLRIDIENDTVLEDADVLIVQTTGANAAGDQNQRIMELIMMISAAKRAKASKIRVINPYFAYSRQDKAFRPGECLFATEVLKWIERAGATEFYTIDIHAETIFDAVDIPTFNLDPMEILAQIVKDRNVINPIVICPDKGAYERSRAFARYLGEDIPVVQFNKTRDVKTGEITMEGDIDVNGREVIIADDIIATGGTMARALGIAKKAGAKSIYAVGTHPLLIKNATYKLLKAGTTEIIGSDTIDSIAMQASMAEVIGKAIKKN